MKIKIINKIKTSLKTVLLLLCIVSISCALENYGGVNPYGIKAEASVSYTVDDSHYDDTEDKIYDYADLFTDNEESTLQEMLVSAAKKTKLDLVIVTTDKNIGGDTLLYASDFYDDNGFGYDYDCGSGVILVIDMYNREAAVSTAGLCRVYMDRETDDMIDEITSYLSDEDYLGASKYFINRVKELASDAADDSDYEEAFEAWYSSDYSSISAQNDFYDKYIKQDNFFTTFKNPVIDIVIALIIAGIAVLIMGSSSKTKVTVNEKTYMLGGHINLSVRNDRFTHTTTTKRKIQTNNSRGGSGHGGGHVSSSGHSHGGSRGKF